MSLLSNAVIPKGHDPRPAIATPLPADLFKCPVCGYDLSTQPNFLVCTNGHSFPYKQNVIDFSSAEEIDHIQRRSERSFGVEWTQYYATLGWTAGELSVEKE